MAFRFRQFKVYLDAKLLHRETTILVNSFPRNYLYLADQMRRASLSVVLNIAEGSSKQSDKDFNRFLTISFGSVDELVACFDIASDLGLIDSTRHSYFEKAYELVCNQLGGFSKHLKS